MTSFSQSAIEDCDIPTVLQASVDRHRVNLSRLITSLQSAGIDDARIEASVTAVVASYRQELLAAIRTMMKSTENV